MQGTPGSFDELRVNSAGESLTMKLDASAAPTSNLATPTPKYSDPGISLLKILIVAALIVFGLNAVTLAIEAWEGTLDMYALRSFLIKAGPGLVLITAVLRRIRARER